MRTLGDLTKAVITKIEKKRKGNMKGMYSGNEDWLSRQHWIPIALVAVMVIGGWAVGSQRKQGVAYKNSATLQMQPIAEPKTAAPEPITAAPSEEETVETVSAAQSRSATLDDAAKHMTEHKACLESAKHNPSTICK
jgi:hypothetical protein